MDFFKEYPELAADQKKLEQAKKETLKGEMTALSADPLKSRIAGLPYWSEEAEWPKNEQGQALHFLAQINFGQIPQLEGYPEQGILQFFINADDDLLGLDFSNRLEGEYAVLYHEQVDAAKASQAPGPTIEQGEISPLNGEGYDLVFEKKWEAIPLSDFQFGKLLGSSAYTWFDQIEEDGKAMDAYDTYSENYSSTGHKIGGYAFFTQSDPRPPDFQEYTELLLQLDSRGHLMWGDMGVANFFIRPADLKKRDFSQVLYTWDCH